MNGDYDLEKRRLEYSARINPGNAERRMENEKCQELLSGYPEATLRPPSGHLVANR